MTRYVRLSDLLDGAPVPERDVEAAEREPEPAADRPRRPTVPRSRVAVVEHAAQRIAAFETRPGGEEFEAASADDVLRDALGPCRGWGDLMRWARLARSAYQRAADRRR